jgi:ubiquinone/menaquinone biosynthesis C-methylase UbiE
MLSVSPEQRASLDYDRRAETYARHRGVHPGVVHAFVGSGLFSSETRVLDVGCGTGNYASVLSSATGCRMTGVEPSAKMVNLARGAAPWESLVQGNAEHLPFDDGSFDVVMSTDVIHHIGDRNAYFREAARVLRPGGHLATVTDSHEDLARRRPLTSHFPETLAIELRRYPPIDCLLVEMAAAGFVESRVETVMHEYELTDLQAFRDRAYSSLLLISEDAFQRGLSRLEADLARGPVPSVSLYTLAWGSSPASRRAAEERG